MRSNAPPLNFPSGLASATVPAASAPSGTTTFPLAEIGCATVPENVSPELLPFELRVFPSRMTMCSPAGMDAVSAPAAVFEPGTAAREPGVEVAGVLPPCWSVVCAGGADWQPSHINKEIRHR